MSCGLRGSIPDEVFERIAFEFPKLKALGWYCQELMECCGMFYINDGEYVCIHSPSDDLSETELLAFSGDVEAQLETDDLMWIKQAALQGRAEAQIRLAEEYQNCSNGSDMYWEPKRQYL